MIARIAAIQAWPERSTGYVCDRLPKVYRHELVSLIFALP